MLSILLDRGGNMNKEDIFDFMDNGGELLDRALQSVNIAQDFFAYKYGNEFDIDWAMEQFSTVADILERLKEYEERAGE